MRPFLTSFLWIYSKFNFKVQSKHVVCSFLLKILFKMKINFGYFFVYSCLIFVYFRIALFMSLVRYTHVRLNLTRMVSLCLILFIHSSMFVWFNPVPRPQLYTHSTKLFIPNQSGVSSNVSLIPDYKLHKIAAVAKLKGLKGSLSSFRK